MNEVNMSDLTEEAGDRRFVTRHMLTSTFIQGKTKEKGTNERFWRELIPWPYHLHTYQDVFYCFLIRDTFRGTVSSETSRTCRAQLPKRLLLISGLILTVWNQTREPHLAFLSSLADSERQVESLRSMKMMENIWDSLLAGSAWCCENTPI